MLLISIDSNCISFNPEVWGTVSDWLMLAVTFIAGLYVVKTFKSQREIQRIEQKRFAMELKPVFFVEKKIEQVNTNIVLFLRLTIKENIPTKVVYELRKLPDSTEDISGFKQGNFNISSWQTTTPMIIKLKIKEKFPDYILLGELHLTYYDILGINKYRTSFPLVLPPLNHLGIGYIKISEFEGPYLL